MLGLGLGLRLGLGLGLGLGIGLGIGLEAFCLLPTYTDHVKVGGGGGVCSVCLEEPRPGAQWLAGYLPSTAPSAWRSPGQARSG